MASQASDDDQQAYRDFQDTVNMTPSEIEDWLGTEESKSVGQKSDGGESTGHASGRRIANLLRSKKTDLSAADYSHMPRVGRHPFAGFAARLVVERAPKEGIATTLAANSRVVRSGDVSDRGARWR